MGCGEADEIRAGSAAIELEATRTGKETLP
jgi:hypothetical protein